MAEVRKISSAFSRSIRSRVVSRHSSPSFLARSITTERATPGRQPDSSEGVCTRLPNTNPTSSCYTGAHSSFMEGQMRLGRSSKVFARFVRTWVLKLQRISIALTRSRRSTERTKLRKFGRSWWRIIQTIRLLRRRRGWRNNFGSPSASPRTERTAGPPKPRQPNHDENERDPAPFRRNDSLHSARIHGPPILLVIGGIRQVEQFVIALVFFFVIASVVLPSAVVASAAFRTGLCIRWNVCIAEWADLRRLAGFHRSLPCSAARS